MRGVVLDLESLDHKDLNLDRLKAIVDHWDFYAATSLHETAARIQNADIVVTNKVVIGTQELDAAKRLQLICVAATGTNNIDLTAARKRNVPVCNVRAYGTPSVVEQLFAGLLTLVRRLDDNRRDAANGTWSNSRQFCLLDNTMRELSGKRLGIVGYGELGRGVARVAEAFGMEVLIANRPGGQSQTGRFDLDDLLPQVDVLTLHCPLTKETDHLIGVRELSQLPSHAILINTARGGIVDETALADALKSGAIGGAVVDVLSEEPPKANNPLLGLDLPNLIVTPHIAWASLESRQRLMDQVALNVEEFLQGRPRNLV